MKKKGGDETVEIGWIAVESRTAFVQHSDVFFMHMELMINIFPSFR